MILCNRPTVNDIETSSIRVFSSFEIVHKIARAELELWVLLRARTQISRLELSRTRPSEKHDEPSSSRGKPGLGLARLHP
ncbi:hypothetical protein Hanom_Chr12g01066651 [Helianthus anomalus]